MTERDKKLRYEQLFEKVSKSNVFHWAKNFIEELSGFTRTPEQLYPTKYLSSSLILNKYSEAKKRLIMLDYDGTLTPIRKIPSEATPSSKLLSGLKVLTNDPNNIVFVISGRDQAVLDEWLGQIPHLGLR